MAGRTGGGFSITISATDAASRTIDGINKRLATLSAPAERFNKSLEKFGEVSGLNRISEGIKELGRSSLDAFRSLDRMAGSLAAITSAASIAGIIEYSRQWGELGHRLEQLSYRVNAPVDRLSALEQGARLAGASSDALDKGLVTLGDTLSAATFGRDTHAIELFNGLGVSFGVAGVKARTATEALGDIADAIQKLPDPRTQARVVRELFGGEELLPFLKRGREGIKEYTDEAARLGGVITPDMAARADELAHSIWMLEVAAKGVANQIADKFAPAITVLNERLANWAARNREIISSDLLKWLNDIGDWFDRHPQLAGFLIGAAAGYKLAGPLGAIAGGVAGSMPGGPFQGPIQLPNDQPTPERPFSWWNPGTWLHHSNNGGDGGTGGRASAPPLPGTPAAAVAQRAHDFWRSQGYTEEQTAGILARMNRESRFDPQAVGDNGTSFGLFQHHADRLGAMQRRYGTAIPTERQQLEYAAWEMSPEGPERAAGDAVRRSRTAEESAMAFTGGFERPADTAGEAMRTGREAGRYVGLFDAGPNGVPGQSGQAGPAGVPGQPGVAGLNGQPGQAGLNGHVQVDVNLKNAPPGTTAQVQTRGPVTAPPPRIETAMPMVN